MLSSIQCRGTFICSQDADDIMLPSRVRLQLEAYLNHNCKGSISTKDRTGQETLEKTGSVIGKNTDMHTGAESPSDTSYFKKILVGANFVRRPETATRFG